MRFLLLLLLSAIAAKADNPIETGTVNWNRDFEAALKSSKETGKPVFALFQEVPGCAGCQKFGREVLSHPLLVEAIETEFTPTVIYNNQGGKDRELLNRFKEPAWNYQVVRFLDSEAKDIIPRKDRVWEIGPLASRMVAALEAKERAVPNYLKALSLGDDASKIETAAFAMLCFWTGEMKLGQLDGVITTEAGWFEGREVTLVRYRNDQISFAELASAAAKVDCADKIYASSDEQLKTLGDTRLKTGKLSKTYRRAKDSDQRRQIAGTQLMKLGLTPVQATKVNAWARVNGDQALSWLSPSQLKKFNASR
ncbi:MAG: VPGUxxT family thioredoxin-like (seleno)protein, type 2 [Verrucomicrobiota bacterium]